MWIIRKFSLLTWICVVGPLWQPFLTDVKSFQKFPILTWTSKKTFKENLVENFNLKVEKVHECPHVFASICDPRFKKLVNFPEHFKEKSNSSFKQFVEDNFNDYTRAVPTQPSSSTKLQRLCSSKKIQSSYKHWRRISNLSWTNSNWCRSRAFTMVENKFRWISKH